MSIARLCRRSYPWTCWVYSIFCEFRTTTRDLVLQEPEIVPQPQHFLDFALVHRHLGIQFFGSSSSARASVGQMGYPNRPRRCPKRRSEPLDHRSARIRPCRASLSHLASMARNHPCGSFSRATDFQFRSLRQNSRYKNGTSKRCALAFLAVPYRALQSDRCLVINVIQPVSALSRRKRGFKSRRGRQRNHQ
jgi:hypothetical protein